MPSITTIHESLPYIDPEPTHQDLAAANALIATERSLVPDDPHHALLPPPLSSDLSTTPFLTPLLQSELTRLATSPDPSNSKLNALDLSRYEAFDPPSLPPSSTTAQKLTTLTTALSRAHALQSYLSHRRANLALLDTYGKNAWLVGNWHMEGELKALEKELAEAKKAIDVLTLQRKTAQEEVGPEMVGLEENWKEGVGRALGTESATESLRKEVLEAMRRGA